MATQAQIAQSVEQRTENPRVGGSIPPLGIVISKTNDNMSIESTYQFKIILNSIGYFINTFSKFSLI